MTDVGRRDYLNRWYGGVAVTQAQIPTGAWPVAVTAGTTTAGADFALPTPGGIAGAVSAAGLSVTTLQHSVAIRVYDSTTTRVTVAWLDPLSQYEVTGLAPGLYFLRTDTFGLNLVDEWYPNQPFDGANMPTGVTSVQVAETSLTVNIHFTLAQGGAVAGLVEDTNGVGVADALVGAFDLDNRCIRTCLTESNGTYCVMGLTNGMFYVRTYLDGPTLVPEWYDDVGVAGWSIQPGALPLAVVPGATNAGRDFALAEGAEWGPLLLPPPRAAMVATGFLRGETSVARLDSLRQICLSVLRRKVVGRYFRPRHIVGTFPPRKCRTIGRPECRCQPSVGKGALTG